MQTDFDRKIEILIKKSEKKHHDQEDIIKALEDKTRNFDQKIKDLEDAGQISTRASAEEEVVE